MKKINIIITFLIVIIIILGGILVQDYWNDYFIGLQQKKYDLGIEEGKKQLMANVLNQLNATGQLRIQTNDGVIILIPKQSE